MRSWDACCLSQVRGPGAFYSLTGEIRGKGKNFSALDSFLKKNVFFKNAFFLKKVRF